MAFVLLTAIALNAQSKVFKEVSDDISSQIQPIIQDNALVGYLVFTQLEKASEDSFNYKVTIMDENLNDIGVVNFRNIQLKLQAVAFEQDVLCLAYLKSDIGGKNFKRYKEYKNASQEATSEVALQFLNLDGKIIKENNVKVETDDRPVYTYSKKGKYINQSSLKHGIQLSNIPGVGFGCIYGDNDKTTLAAYNATGDQKWSQKVEDATGYALLTTKDDIFILSKKRDGSVPEGGYSVTVYGVNDSKKYLNYRLEDKEGNPLKVLAFKTDLKTGQPYVSGNIINSHRAYKYYTLKHVTTGAYDGVFTVDFKSHNKKDIVAKYSNWADGSLMPSITTKGRSENYDAYAVLSNSMRDYDGNTYFVGSSIVKRTKWGTVASSSILMGSAVVAPPLAVISPIVLGLGGTHKCKVQDAMVLKQTPDGALSVDNMIDCNSSKFMQTRWMLSDVPLKSFYNVSNVDTKSNYIIVDDTKDIVIYNVNQKKIARTVPHKDGQVRTNVFPAKEGHVMVAEYNRKEHYTRYSIEAL